MGKLHFAQGVVFRREPAGGIFFNIDTGALQIAEGVAFGICHMIDQGSTREEILQELEERYPDQKNLEGDLDAFIEQLREKGVLV